MLVAWFRNYQEIQIVSRDRYCFRDALKKQLAQLGTYQNQVSEEHLPLLAAEELTCSENRKSERLLKQVIRQEEEKMFCLFSAKFIPPLPSGTPFT